MSVYLQPHSPYFIIEFVFRGRRIRRSSRTSNKRAAQAMEERLKAEVRNEFVQSGIPYSSSRPSNVPSVGRDILQPRRGLNRVEAANYLGVTKQKFDEMVSSCRLPKAKILDGILIWDLRALDNYFDELPTEESPPRRTASRKVQRRTG